MTNEQTHNQEAQLAVPQSNGWNIFLPENRGMLFDIIIFLTNLLFMRYITAAFTNTAQGAYAGNHLGQLVIFLFFLSMFIFQPLGAQFKRWQFHQRRRAGRRRKSRADSYIFTFADNIVYAIIFNPLLHFLALLGVSLLMTSFLTGILTGKSTSDDDSGFIIYVLIAFLITVAHSASVYHYFTSPSKEPKKKIFYKGNPGLIGDLLIFCDIFIYQLLWNIAGEGRIGATHGIGDFWMRAFFLVAMALAVYMPSRIFYFAEDIRKPLAWITIALAISPLLLRFLSSS